MNLKRCWTKRAFAYSNVLSLYFSEDTEEKHEIKVIMVGRCAENLTQNFQYTKHLRSYNNNYYCYYYFNGKSPNIFSVNNSRSKAGRYWTAKYICDLCLLNLIHRTFVRLQHFSVYCGGFQCNLFETPHVGYTIHYSSIKIYSRIFKIIIFV
jgi:hypothetical protein